MKLPKHWGTRRHRDEFLLTYKGNDFPAEPRMSEEDAVRAARHFSMRYQEEFLTWVSTPKEDEEERQRGGPWSYTYDDQTGVIHTSRLADAKAALRRSLDRQRLPNGIEWSVET